jgi:predicted DsbA family dithiol-disulfide isomerase
MWSIGQLPGGNLIGSGATPTRIPMTATFAITFDYLCPFARNANESVVEGLNDGADWKVTFRPFSLAQTKVDEGETAVWHRDLDADGTRGVLALRWGLAVRDGWPEQFPAFHLALFAARHEYAVDIGDGREIARVAEAVGLDSVAVAAEVASGKPMATLAAEHQDLVHRWDVFGVPTFIMGDEAVFVRLMERHQPDEVGRIAELIAWGNLNEFKRTRIAR